MNKASVEKALEKGSVKQRALILSNHLADVNSGGKGFLTDKEFQALGDSFKSNKEIEVYNRYRTMFKNVQLYLTNLSQFRLGYMEAIGRLDKFVLLRKGNSDTEELVNNLLELMPDKKTRAKAAKIAVKFSNPFLMRHLSMDKEGYVQTKHDELDEVIRNSQVAARAEQVHLKTAIAVIKDYLEETGFNVKVYWKFVKEVETWAKSKQHKGLSIILTDRTIEALKSPSLRALFEKDSLEAPYERVEIDKEKYEFYRRNYLNA